MSMSTFWENGWTWTKIWRKNHKKKIEEIYKSLTPLFQKRVSRHIGILGISLCSSLKIRWESGRDFYENVPSPKKRSWRSSVRKANPKLSPSASHSLCFWMNTNKHKKHNQIQTIFVFVFETQIKFLQRETQ